MKTNVVILNNQPGERLAIEFYLTRAMVKGIFFDSAAEMENWLWHCLDEETPVVAAIVDCASVELSIGRFPCNDVLRSKKIPLIIAGSSRDIGDWFEVSDKTSDSIPVFLAPLTLLPQLLEQIRQTKFQAASLTDPKGKVNSHAG